MVGWLALSSVANGVAQASDYVALKQAGQMLYTILHSSVTFFACLIAFVCQFSVFIVRVILSTVSVLPSSHAFQELVLQVTV